MEKAKLIKPLIWESYKDPIIEVHHTIVPFGDFSIKRGRKDYKEGEKWGDWKITETEGNTVWKGRSLKKAKEIVEEIYLEEMEKFLK